MYYLGIYRELLTSGLGLCLCGVFLCLTVPFWVPTYSLVLFIPTLIFWFHFSILDSSIHLKNIFTFSWPWLLWKKLLFLAKIRLLWVFCRHQVWPLRVTDFQHKWLHLPTGLVDCSKVSNSSRSMSLGQPSSFKLLPRKAPGCHKNFLFSSA